MRRRTPHHSDACRCPRPCPSGRVYHGYEACVTCDKIVTTYEERRRMELQRTEERERNFDRLRRTPRYWERHMEQLEQSLMRGRGR